MTIYPGEIHGRETAAPPSKSMAHRELICAGLAGGVSIISNLALSEDILATMDCLRALGSEIVYDRLEMTAKVKGAHPGKRPQAVMPCRESGSTMRFMIPVCALSENFALMTGSGRLPERPMGIYEDILRRQGLTFERSYGGTTVGGVLSGGEFCMPGDVSSQFVSGLLFALPLCSSGSIIKLEGEVQSRPYIDMTLKALKAHGVRAEWKSASLIEVPGRQEYIPSDVRVEGDWSNAANLMAAGASVSGLDADSLQGDRICKEYFRKLDSGYAELDIADCPDLGPVLMAYAAMRSGAFLMGTRRLRFKESDRGEAMKEELSKFGVDAEIYEDSIAVGSGISSPCTVLDGHNDHRIVMALAAMCIRTGGSIDGAEAVNKSFPDYFETISRLGVKIEKENGSL